MTAFPGRFRCRSNPRSFHINSRCNNASGCPDNSDEQGCSAGVCGVHQYRCANGKCIRGGYVCNGRNDCGDSCDEMYCSRFTNRGSCSAWSILCNNGKCIKGDFGCNTEVCTNANSSQAQMCKLQGKCKHNEGQCENSKCIPLNYFCNGYNDCGDNSDERNCNVSSTDCPRNEFSCDNGMCVPMSAKCDGINHCGDGSDEWNCPKPPGGCKQCEFSCVRTGQCVPWSARCDGLFHCTDGSDEWADACKADTPAGCSDVPPCRTSPDGLNCGADEFVPHNESRICSCLNTCRRVEITCLTNGSWSQYNEQCSKPLQKFSNTVATCFTNGKYKFKCANGFKQISGNSTAVCDNGLLKFFEKLRCEKIIASKEKIGLVSITSWAVVGTSLLLFSILYIAIGIYCYRKDERMFAAFEQNVPKIVDEPSASTSTAV